MTGSNVIIHYKIKLFFALIKIILLHFRKISYSFIQALFEESVVKLKFTSMYKNIYVLLKRSNCCSCSLSVTCQVAVVNTTVLN